MANYDRQYNRSRYDRDYDEGRFMTGMRWGRDMDRNYKEREYYRERPYYSGDRNVNDWEGGEPRRYYGCNYPQNRDYDYGRDHDRAYNMNHGFSGSDIYDYEAGEDEEDEDEDRYYGTSPESYDYYDRY